jgi:2-isopropylmalate synthase
VDPGLDLSDIDEVAAVAEHCNRLPIHPRHPYAGELVYTAFSGSHQDAIKKGMAAQRASKGSLWEVPYLPLDPADVGRTYEAVIRVNSQSGKGGVAWVLEHDHGLRLPRALQVEFSQVVQTLADATGEELASDRIRSAFDAEYLTATGPLALLSHESVPEGNAGQQTLRAVIRHGEASRVLRGRGNGPIDAFVDALRREFGTDVRVTDYSEHAAGEGADAVAVAYLQATVDAGERLYGVGRDSSIVTASLQAVVSAVNRAGRRA